jgi:hypothetical protein
MISEIANKHNALKSAIDKYNDYNYYVELYNSTKSLESYIDYIHNNTNGISKSSLEHYEKIIKQYYDGNVEPLLLNLYDKLLAADECKTRTANELNSLLREYAYKAC